MQLREVARVLAAPVIGDDSLSVERIVHPADAVGPADLAVALSADSLAALDRCRAQAVVISAASQPPTERFKAVILAQRQRASLAALTRLFDRGPERTTGIHPTAVVAADAVLEPGASLGPFVVVGARSRIGADTVLVSNVTVGSDVIIGANATMHPGARIADRVRLGDRVIVEANAVIGSDGFSFVPVERGGTSETTCTRPQRIHSLGTVMVEDDVEIGAGSTIDRATLRATRIGRRTKIDNQVHIAHNVTIGEDCLICAMTGISGSVRVGDRVLIGGGVGIVDHVIIGADAVIAAGSGVGSNVAAGMTVSGFPAMKHERSIEHLLYLGRQKALHARVADLQSRIDALEEGLQRDIKRKR